MSAREDCEFVTPETESEENEDATGCESDWSWR